MRHKRLFLKKLGLLAGGIFVGVLLTECSLYFLNMGYPLPYSPDENCGTRLTPGFRGWWTKEGKAFIEINSIGFRDREHAKQKPPNTLRIAVLGDSYVEALQVPLEQTFSSVLQRELTKSHVFGDKNIEVLSFGVSGFGTAQQLLVLRNYVWQFDPDIILLAFFPGNDICNNSRELEQYRVRPFFYLENGELKLDNSFRELADFQKSKSSWVKFKVWLINHSRILQLVNEARNRKEINGRSDHAENIFQIGIDNLAFIEPQDEAAMQAWNLTEQLISQMHREVREKGKSFVLAVLTTDIQIHLDAAKRNETMKQLGVSDLQYGDRRLQTLGEKEGFLCIHLSQRMKKDAQQRKLFLHGFPNTALGEGHWNAAGHHVAGRLISEAIRAEAQ